MSSVEPPPSSIVILFDRDNKHSTLDEDRYVVFHRITIFNDALHLIDTGQYGQIDLHVPTDFNFNDMRPHPEVYIHTYFVDNEETSNLNNIERQKIRESIRLCCELVGEEFIQRGIMDWNDQFYDEAINIAEQLVLLDQLHRDQLPT